MKYITTPPQIPDLLSYLIKRYIEGEFIYELIEWARKEYYDMVIYLWSTDMNSAKELESPKYSYLNFLAHCSAFKKLLENMNGDVWNSLDKGTRNILIQAKDLYNYS